MFVRFIRDVFKSFHGIFPDLTKVQHTQRVSNNQAVKLMSCGDMSPFLGELPVPGNVHVLTARLATTNSLCDTFHTLSRLTSTGGL